MSKEALVAAVKNIMALARAGQLDDAYRGYVRLFTAPDFLNNRPEDQRQALRLMIVAKGVPNPPSQAMLEAHRATLGPLTELVSAFDEPADYELLGICHIVLGNTDSAARIFRAGLTIERERNAASDLCGSLMKRVSLL